MKYYDYLSNFEINPDLINKYIVERDSNNDVYKVCFDDSQIDEYFKTTNANWVFDLGLSAYFIGNDGFFMNLSLMDLLLNIKSVMKR